MTKIRKSTWNTYAMRGYSYDVANDQASAGGIHLHQIRKVGNDWQKRIIQSNGPHKACGETSGLSDVDGAAAFATAQTY